MYSLAIFTLMVLQLSATNGYWWSLGVNEISQPGSDYDPSSLNCISLNNTVLTNAEVSYCEDHKSIVQLMAIYTRQGIVHCQRLFAGSLWNCTTFQGDHLFGEFITDSDTKEKAFVNAMLAGSSAVGIAKTCRDETIDDCTCSISGFDNPDPNAEGFVTYKCDDDPAFAKQAVNTFLNDNEEFTSDTVTPERKSEIHNHNVGLELLQDRTLKCKCVGLSGTCTVRDCYYETMDIEKLGQKLKDLYSSAVRVILNEQKTGLVPFLQNAVFNSSFLSYVDNSPSFCTTDLSKGIIGSENRQCTLDSNDPYRCDVMCCGRGYYVIQKDEMQEVCEFVWCCKVVCEEKPVKVTTYYCNP